MTTRNNQYNNMMRLDQRRDSGYQIKQIYRTVEQLWQKNIANENSINVLEQTYTNKEIDTNISKVTPIEWIYANEAVRLAARGFVSTDVHKYAYQTDNETTWMLLTTTSTWVAVETDKPHRDYIDFDTTPDGYTKTTGRLGYSVSASGLETPAMTIDSLISTTISGTSISGDTFTGITGNFTNVNATTITGDLVIASIGELATKDTVQDRIDSVGSSGYFIGGDITNHATPGTVTIAAGEGFVRETTSSTAPLLQFGWDEASIAIPLNTTRYVFVSDTGVVSIDSDEFIEAADNIMIGVATNEGGVIESRYNLGVRLEESIGQAGRYIRRVHSVIRDTRKGGLRFSETGTRNLAMSAGTLWWGRTEYPISIKDTSVSGGWDTYTSTGLKIASDETQWDNTQYDNAGTLTTMTNNRWANHWIFIEPDDQIVLVYGRAQYVTQVQAEAEIAPNSSLPNRLTAGGILAARLIFKKSASTGSISSAFDTVFIAGGSADDHGGLTGLGDDDHTQYTRVDGTRDFVGNQGFSADGLKMFVGANNNGSITYSGDVIYNSRESGTGNHVFEGGNVGIHTDNPTFPLVVKTTTNAYGLMIGDINNNHVRLAGTAGVSVDYSLIQSFNDATPSTLQINRDGGDVLMPSVYAGTPGATNKTLSIDSTGKLAPSVNGSFTGTLTGVTTSVTGTLYYSINNGVVTLSIPYMFGTSNTNGCTITGMSSAIKPSGDRKHVIVMMDDGLHFNDGILLGIAGVFQLFKGTPIGFTSSGSKGIIATTIQYRL